MKKSRLDIILDSLDEVIEIKMRDLHKQLRRKMAVQTFYLGVKKLSELNKIKKIKKNGIFYLSKI